ncbi:centromere protein J-like isoform X2 [Xenia sp. Carnegie-2017]|uniref:centromere protein J-like isoform X2 n=1 Tax=Xenia sp. Carnegie-2017 TaxID=2897299 RepID=UPI001F049117|nr:centromere protein J-like isoform X2 [Xenia sp. Carnegie-2017]
MIKDSFQEMMKNWEETKVVEKQELNEFELLEEAAAANCSLSSNSSTVLRFLGKKVIKQGNPDVNNNDDFTKSTKIQTQSIKENDGNHTLTEEDQFDKDETLKQLEVVSLRSSLALSDDFDDTKTWDENDVLNSGKQHVSQKLQDTCLQSKTMVRTVEPVTRENSIPNVEENTDPQSGMSYAVRKKLQELEKEIEKFREENIALHKLREEREKDFQNLQKERSSFEKYKTQELERLEKFKTEEEKRLRRDKRIFEQYQKASRALPDKKEREEITVLKSKITELQEELKLRETRWSAAITRYKDRISALENEVREIRNEAKLLEKQNFDLQKKEQQKSRERQEFKGFEKQKSEIPSSFKVHSPEEIQSKKTLAVISDDEPVCAVRNKSFNTHETENYSLVESKSTSDYNNKIQFEENIDSILKQNNATQSPLTMKNAQKHTSPSTENAQKHTSPSTENARKHSSPSTENARKHSSPTKQSSSQAKSVRFKEDTRSHHKITPHKQFSSDGKRETINPDGSRVVTFANGTRKEISDDGLSVVVTFFNGDIKQIFPDKRVEYFYAEVKTTHTTYPDGLEVLHFPSGQIEKHYPDGTKEIIFPDATVKYFYTSGDEECVFTDGTVERINRNGERLVEFPNGQREIYTELFKKREFPDGTVKTVYFDGRQETRYASGRLRVKDSEGRILVDTAEKNSPFNSQIVST